MVAVRGPVKEGCGMRPKRARYVVVCLLIVGVFALIWMKMYDLQIVLATDYTQQAQSKTTKTLSLTGKRGTIYDANMTPLAYDRESFNVQFYRDPSRSSDEDRAAYTQSIIKTIELVEANGKTTIDEFWLAKDEEGNWYFDTGTTNPTTAAKREEQWRSNFYLTTTPVEDLFDTLCTNYAIPEELSEEMKLKVLAIWQKSRMYNYLSLPVTIAEDVGMQTVGEVEARSVELDGMSIEQGYTRVYPKGDLAAHVIGYTSKISGEQTLRDYQEKGYSTDATVGQAGIEYSMEAYLTPQISYRKGQRVVELDNRGKIIREISYQAPVDGDDIILTIDSQLQQVMQDALEANIKGIHNFQENEMNKKAWRQDNQEELLAYEERGQEVQMATSGAAVAMDPNSGRILAMASYPTFDLSQFEGGRVSSAYWNELVNNQDNPLYNRAISTRDTPGSCFKMVTALAGLMEGAITLETTISDKGPFDTGDVSNQPRCWASAATRKSQHQNQTVVEGLKNSCNYFFYQVGMDTGIDNLVKWAARLGLTSKTNIELPAESTSFVGNQLMLYDSDRAIDDQYTSKPYFASVMIKRKLREVGEDRGIEYDEDRLDKVAKMILDLVNQEGTKEQWIQPIREILMEQMNLPSSYIQSHYMVNTFVSYINDLRWTASETVMAAIGQSITQITPVAAARYVSAVANGGTVYDAQIVDKIVSPSGEIVVEKEPVVANRITGAADYLAAIQAGMQDVTDPDAGGTASSRFAKAKYAPAAKTGTAQRSDIDIENNSWLVTYAPKTGTPEIVVVVYIQNGYAGSYSSSTAIATIDYYLDSIYEKSDTLTVPQANTLAE